jgi:two-component system phosphate regulon sensor histidine kinase PhoR
VVANIAADRVSRVTPELAAAVRRMAGGDLGIRTHVEGQDEIADLGHAIDRLAERLSASLSELRAERDLGQRVIDGMQEGVLVLDADNRVELVNPSLRSMMLLGADVAGKELLEVIRHAELDDLLKRARSAKGVTLGEIELPGLKPRKLLVYAGAIAGEEQGLLAVFVDVTDLRRLESHRRDFVANVSHELRTPVTAVRSAAETLRESAIRDPVAAARFIDIIDRNAQRLQALIEDLLELSRLESKELKLRKEQVDVDAVAQIVLGLFRERAEKKGVRLSARIPSPAPRLVGDQRALEQVLSNLVDNAVKYCPAGASVVVSAGQEDGATQITVEDTGPGIDARHLPRLFERFYRVDTGRSREVGGTGLGLSIVKHMAEAMGGEVGVESAVGKGTTFKVTLPSR